jgi:hypothetical protein
VLPAGEVCGDGLDTDCDGLGGPDAPEEPTCCVAQEETCNELDDDCDGLADEGLRNRCGQCPGTGSCYGVAFEDAGDCEVEGRHCEGVLASPLDGALITLPPPAGTGSGAALFAAVTTVNFDYEVIKLDVATGDVVWRHNLGRLWTSDLAASPDGSVWVRHLYEASHLSSDGEVVCKVEKIAAGFTSGGAVGPDGDSTSGCSTGPSPATSCAGSRPPRSGPRAPPACPGPTACPAARSSISTRRRRRRTSPRATTAR